MSEKNELPKGWVQATVGEIAKAIQYGHTASASDNPHGPRFLRITDIQNGQVVWDTVPSCHISVDELPKYRLDCGDIVFARTGATTGKSFLIRQCPDAVFASYLIRLRMFQGVYPSFVQAFFQTNDYWRQIETGKRGIGQPNVNANVLGKIRIPLAPENEQRRIVAKIEELFSDLDAGVTALERIKANLKCYRSAVLKAAVEGRLTEAWRAKNPKTEPASKLLERILAERRKKWEEDQLAKFATAGKSPPKGWREKYVEPAGPDTRKLPELPQGWCWASVEQLGQVQLGRQRSPKNRSNKYPTKYIRAANITENGLALDDILDMDFSPSEKETYRLHAGDLVLSEASGSADQVGKPAVWNDEIENCCFQNTVIRFRPHRLTSSFVLVVLRDYYFNKSFAKIVAGVGINHLSAAKFSVIPFPLAPITEQQEIASEVERRLSIIAAAQTQVDTNLKRAARLRQSILKLAFEGKLVPQDPTDESADKLLERIQVERNRIEKGKQPKQASNVSKRPTDQRKKRTGISSRARQ